MANLCGLAGENAITFMSKLEGEVVLYSMPGL